MNEEIPIPGREDNPGLFKQLLVGSGGPAFLRRSRQVEAAYEHLLDRCRKQRQEWLTLVRIRLATLFALAGGWDALRPLLEDETQINLLQLLHSELIPQLRSKVLPTNSARSLHRALVGLIENIERFNRRWLEYLPGVDLRAVNDLREKYNRFYILEKECAVRLPSLARQGFCPLRPLTCEDLQALLPPLPVPRRRLSDDKG